MTVWLLVEDHGDEKEHVGLYGSPEAARVALSALVGDAPLNWLDGGTDSVTLAFVRSGDQAGERPSRTFQIYPLEVEREEGVDDPAPDEMRTQVHVHRHPRARRRARRGRSHLSRPWPAGWSSTECLLRIDIWSNHGGA